MSIERPRQITFLKTYGNHHVGDGLQVSEATALEYVNAGIAAYSEDYHAGPSAIDTALADLQAQIDAAVLRIEALE